MLRIESYSRFKKHMSAYLEAIVTAGGSPSECETGKNDPVFEGTSDHRK